MVTRRRSFGDSGEALAAKYLQENGYAIVATNFLVREGEIDIIAQKADELIFVEVKTRRNKAFGEAVEAITPEKEEKIFLAIEQYLFRHEIPEEQPWRADVILIDFSAKTPQIQHIKNALA